VEAQVSPVTATCTGNDIVLGGSASATLTYQYQVIGSGTWQHRITGLSVYNVNPWLGWSNPGSTIYPSAFPTYWTAPSDPPLAWFGMNTFANILYGNRSAGAYFSVSQYGSCTVTNFQ